MRGREREGVGGASQLTPSTLTKKPRRSRKLKPPEATKHIEPYQFSAILIPAWN